MNLIFLGDLTLLYVFYIHLYARTRQHEIVSVINDFQEATVNYVALKIGNEV